MYTYKEIIGLCEFYLGSNWFDYFYGEFPEGLSPNTTAFDTLVQCLKNGWTEAEINSHPIYGIHVNVAAYHLNMDRLLQHFPT